MYNERQLNNLNDLGSCGMVAPMSTEETMQNRVADILNMAKRCRELSASIEDSLYGPRPCPPGENESSINCLLDALNKTRIILRDTVEELGGVNKSL